MTCRTLSIGEPIWLTVRTVAPFRLMRMVQESSREVSNSVNVISPPRLPLLDFACRPATINHPVEALTHLLVFPAGLRHEPFQCRDARSPEDLLVRRIAFPSLVEVDPGTIMVPEKCLKKHLLTSEGSQVLQSTPRVFEVVQHVVEDGHIGTR